MRTTDGHMLSLTISRSARRVQTATLEGVSCDILHEILSWLHLGELAVFGSVSSGMRRVVHAHSKSWIFNMITSFDFEPNAIMALLHHTGSVISGSMALVSLFPGDNLIAFRPQDIDFYVPLDMKARAESFFLTSTAYRPIINKKRYYNKYIAEVIFMRHGNKTINIIVSSSANSLSPIFHFHSTAVMNFISSTGVFSAYPSLTFVHRNLVNPEYLKNKRVIQPVEYCMTKYRERGFENGQNLSQWDDICTHKCGEDMFCPRTTRTVSDSGSFKFKFSSQPWIQPGQPDLDVYSRWGSTVWRLGGPACSDVKGGNEGFVVDCKEKDSL